MGEKVSLVRSTPSYQCLFSKGPKSLESVTEFTEDDTIYAHVTCAGLTKGDHILLVWWVRPTGVVQAETKVPFVHKQPKTSVYAWLKFQPCSQPLLSSILSIQEKEKWTVQYFVDGEKLGGQKFLCVEVTQW